MGQQTWNILDITGEEYTLGIYHGEESGHVVVYLNNNIMIIDFKILMSKSYHFFIGHEFMHLKIIKNMEEYTYSLEVDTDADTPYNIQLKAREQVDQRNMMIGLFIAIILLSALFFFRNFK